MKIGDLGFGRLLGLLPTVSVYKRTVIFSAATGERWAHSGVGTPLYFSPELCQESPYNEKSDMWALGLAATPSTYGLAS